jgi:hypothetical protein
MSSEVENFYFDCTKLSARLSTAECWRRRNPTRKPDPSHVNSLSVCLKCTEFEQTQKASEYRVSAEEFHAMVHEELKPAHPPFVWRNVL